jgi:tRNA(Ile)-lysidine synthase TilS/MesJ
MVSTAFVIVPSQPWTFAQLQNQNHHPQCRRWISQRLLSLTTTQRTKRMAMMRMDSVPFQQSFLEKQQNQLRYYHHFLHRLPPSQRYRLSSSSSSSSSSSRLLSSVLPLPKDDNASDDEEALESKTTSSSSRSRATTQQQQPPPKQQPLSKYAQAIHDHVISVVDQTFGSVTATTSNNINTIDDRFDLTKNNTNNMKDSDVTNTNTTTTLVIVLSVSGGCDSVAMFHACIEWYNRINHHHHHNIHVYLHVVHFHHRQRPIDADLDCQFVHDLVVQANQDSRNIIRNNPNNKNDVSEDHDDGLRRPPPSSSPPFPGIVFHVEDWKDGVVVPTTTSQQLQQQQNVQESFSQDKARQWRRQKLLEYTQQQIEQLCRNDDDDDDDDDSYHPPVHLHQNQNENSSSPSSSSSSRNDNNHKHRKAVIGMILTAHHKDDSYESLLLKMLRGVHLLNLVGIEPITILQEGYRDNAKDCNSSDDDDNDIDHQNDSNRNDSDGDTATTFLNTTAQGRIYLLRPWLDYTKLQIIDYLNRNGWTWREDSSNRSSDKYVRNRIRNELIPLLQDMTDNTFLNKRLPIWVDQSELLRDDVNVRVDQYLTKHVYEIDYTTPTTTKEEDTINADGTSAIIGTEDGTNNPHTIHSRTRLRRRRRRSEFWISVVDDPTTTTTTTATANHINTSPFPSSRLIVSQALYRWITNEIDYHENKHRYEQEYRPSSSSKALLLSSSSLSSVDRYLSYQTLQRVVRQLEVYPDRQQWTIELGMGWNLVRRGNVLRIVQNNHNNKSHKSGVQGPAITSTLPTSALQQNALPRETTVIPWRWTMTVPTLDDHIPIVEIRIHTEFLSSDLSFFSTTLGNAIQMMDESGTGNNNNNNNKKNDKRDSFLQSDTSSIPLGHGVDDEVDDDYKTINNNDKKMDTTISTPTTTTRKSEETMSTSGKSWLWFIPPWRTSPIKLRQFLRGQNIPSHLRDDIPLLFMSVQQHKQEQQQQQQPHHPDDYQRRLVAVRLNNNEDVGNSVQWIVHKEFNNATASTTTLYLYPREADDQ